MGLDSVKVGKGGNMRNINVTIPSMPFARIEDRTAAINAAVRNYIRQFGYPELSTDTLAELQELGQTAENVLYQEVKNGYGRYTHIQAYTYDEYGRFDLELFEIDFTVERAIS